MVRLSRLPRRVSGLGARVKALPKRAEGFYASAEWRAYRKAHRAWTVDRQGGVWCVTCGGSGGRMILDHRRERRDGGADFPPFEEADWYCTGCHNRKTGAAKAARARGESAG